MILITVAFLLSTGITGLMRIYARKRNLVDVPNQRSSHANVTPRGGGLSIVLVFLGAVLVLVTMGEIETSLTAAVVLGGGVIAAVGFIDDHSPVPAKWRFLIQIMIAVPVVVILGGLPAVPVGQTDFDLGVAGDILMIVFMVWFTNAFNFMDGIDGIAASEAICIAGGALVLGSMDNGSVSVLLSVLAAASLGFLVWNWPPAKIFMGDVGSAFLGFVLIAVAIYASHRGAVSIWSWLILSGVFVVDSTITLITRVLRGDEWFSAHRSHAYQRSARRFGSHARVTVSVIAINVCWLLPIAFAANENQGHGWWLMTVAWFPLIGVCAWLGAGRHDSEASA